MKKMRFIVFGIICLIYSSNGFADISAHLVKVSYRGEIKGIKVEALWMPNERRNGFVRGPAIIQLVNPKHGTRSTVVNNNFCIAEDRLVGVIVWSKRGDKGDEVKNIAKKELLLDYKYPKIAEEDQSFGTDEEPFFFYDINFDGKDDFLVVEVSMGQRFADIFRAYKFSEYQDIDVLENDFPSITYKDPFLSLDSFTTVNKSNKTITKYISAGAMDSEYKTYKIQELGD